MNDIVRALTSGDERKGQGWPGACEAVEKVKLKLKAQAVVCAVVCAAISPHVAAQTLIDLRTQAKSADFSSMGRTKPAQTGAALPATCSVGEVFFLTTAPAGANLNVCASQNQWSAPSASGGSGSGVTLEADGATIGTATALNLLSTSGSTVTANQAGNTLAISVSPDSSLYATRVNMQNGGDTYCVPTSGNPTVYTCSLPAPLTTYADGMRILWKPDVTCTGGVTTTLAVDGNPAQSIYQNDGVSNPLASQCAASTQVLLAYSGALNSGTGGWRIISGSSGSTSGSSAVTSTMDLPMGGFNVNAAGVYPGWAIDHAGTSFFADGDVPTITLASTGSAFAARPLRLPSNWDPTTPLNVMVTLAGFGSGGNISVNASFACLGVGSTASTNYGSAVSSSGLTSTATFGNLTLPNVSPNGCTPGQMAVLKIARDNTVSGNSTDAVAIVGVAVQWTSR
jgi:hypothetical protein